MSLLSFHTENLGVVSLCHPRNPTTCFNKDSEEPKHTLGCSTGEKVGGSKIREYFLQSISIFAIIVYPVHIHLLLK